MLSVFCSQPWSLFWLDPLRSAKVVLHAGHGLGNLTALREQSSSLFPYRFSTQIPVALTLLGLSIILNSSRQRIVEIIADLAVMLLCLLTLIQVSGFIFAGMRLFGVATPIRTAPQTLLCLFLLTGVALLRRAEYGVFSIFLGRDIGSRIARALTPVLLVLPFAREIGRARLVQVLKIPEQYVTAILASIATIISFVLLLFLAWRINRMEAEIQDLSLRDELTGLYNLRGFNLLAEQMHRLARRSQLPLSVLFIDLDDLKGINDSLGHAAGSAFLAETAELLREVFRETDVMGRIGGDEFVVVCLCSHVAISIATERLKAAAALRNAKPDRKIALSFSVGFVTAEEHGNQALKELLTEADHAMYGEKRQRKITLGHEHSTARDAATQA